MPAPPFSGPPDKKCRRLCSVQFFWSRRASSERCEARCRNSRSGGSGTHKGSRAPFDFGPPECAPDDRLREATHKATKRKNGLLRSARNDVQTRLQDLAARCARVLRKILRPPRGRGECRVPAAPAASRALGSGRTHTSNNEYTGIARHSRTQWFYGLCRALPGDRALLPPSSRGYLTCPRPVGPTCLPQDLTPASGRQDHTILPSAAIVSRQLAW